MKKSGQFSSATRQLKTILKSKVLCSDNARMDASFDGSKLSFMPEAVIHPKEGKDIETVLKLANRKKVPVTVRGGGTSLTGSASPVKGGWVLDLSAWNKIEVDGEAGLVRAQPGAHAEDIHRAVEAHGWLYPPDPASGEYSTIGGNVATNAGGMRGGKYGVTRDFVVALEGYLPTGEFVTWGRATKKFSAGFNLRDLWIGSEGMLGVITSVVLKLVPLPETHWTMLATFKSEEDAFRSVQRLFSQKIQPSVCEFLDSQTVQCAEKVTSQVMFKGQGGRPLILLELAGDSGEVLRQRKVVETWAKAQAFAWRQAKNKKEREFLWFLRKKCSSAMFEMGDMKLNEDIVLPIRSYVPFARFLKQLRKDAQLPIPTFGHLGDGNLHVNIMYHHNNKREQRAAEKAVLSLMQKVVELNGGISGEHGIGLAKSPFLRLQHTPAEIRAMQAVKKALDPKGILNPGKLFTPFKVWDYPRIQRKLPWDHK